MARQSAARADSSSLPKPNVPWRQEKLDGSVADMGRGALGLAVSRRGGPHLVQRGRPAGISDNLLLAFVLHMAIYVGNIGTFAMPCGRNCPVGLQVGTVE